MHFLFLSLYKYIHIRVETEIKYECDNSYE